MRRAVSRALAVGSALLLYVSSSAATEPPLDRAPPSALPDVDIVGPVRAGFGYSRLFQSRVLSLSFEDELMIQRLDDSLSLAIVFGMDAQRALDDVRQPRSFLATTIGSGVLLRPAPDGAAFTLNATAAPLWQSSDESTALVGFGVGLRAESWPFYQSIAEAVECRRGAGATYVLSGLHGFVLARHDWMGDRRGDSYVFGVGIDLGRNVLLPVLGAALNGACAAPLGSAQDV